jgi:triosephosphate isomerase
VVQRRPFIVGNWKMSLGSAAALVLARELKRRLAGMYAGPEVVVCPSFPHVAAVREVLEGSVIGVGAQDLAPQEPGAVTGGVSAEQLRELGARWCILGHSERRQNFGETDEFIAAKIRAAFRVGLTPILCFGETLEVREAGRTEPHVIGQVTRAIEGLQPEQIVAMVLAYEPVWAIGTGRNAEVADAERVHRLVRGLLRERGGQKAADTVRILYGGSVSPENVRGYMRSPDIDGALVGGASLDAQKFVSILCYQDAR